jgi:zinc/manganese transport system substrate-binding protein
MGVGRGERAAAAVVVALVVLSLAGAFAVVLLPRTGPAAGAGRASGPTGQVVDVVAAENTWGSLVAQLGGDRVDVLDVVTDPNADPHEYESNPTDARAFALARYVIVNGAGYDDWAEHLLGAQSVAGRRVLDVARLVGAAPGANPHFWYDPTDVVTVIDRIAADLGRLDPGDRGYFAARRSAVARALLPYEERLQHLRTRFAGTTVASTESIFVYLAQSLRLRLVTPPSFMEAVAEGNDPPAPAEATFYRQIQERAFDLLVYNTQTVTPLTTAIRQAATARGVRVVGVSETLQPSGATFEAWMDHQLDALGRALGAATGR